MIRHAMGAMLVAVLLAAPAAGGEKNAPKPTGQAKDGVQITQENIVKSKLKTVQPVQPNPPMPIVGGPPAPPPPSPSGP